MGIHTAPKLGVQFRTLASSTETPHTGRESSYHNRMRQDFALGCPISDPTSESPSGFTSRLAGVVASAKKGPWQNSARDLSVFIALLFDYRLFELL